MEEKIPDACWDCKYSECFNSEEGERVCGCTLMDCEGEYQGEEGRFEDCPLLPLLPCPFCGGMGIMAKKAIRIVDPRITDEYAMYAISCPNCGANGPFVVAESYPLGELNAKKYWNKRMTVVSINATFDIKKEG